MSERNLCPFCGSQEASGFATPWWFSCGTMTNETVDRSEQTVQCVELEVGSLKKRIKRLEQAGDRLSDCADQIGWTSCESPQWIKKAENAVKEWKQAKEAKP